MEARKPLTEKVGSYTEVGKMGERRRAKQGNIRQRVQRGGVVGVGERAGLSPHH